MQWAVISSKFECAVFTRSIGAQGWWVRRIRNYKNDRIASNCVRKGAGV